MKDKKRSVQRFGIALLSALLALLCLTSCGKDILSGAKTKKQDVKVIGTIGSYEVCYDELRYVVMACRQLLDARYGKEAFADPSTAESYKKELEAMVNERITANYAVFILCDENGLSDIRKDKDAIKYVERKVDSVLYYFASQNGLDVSLDAATDEYVYGPGAKKKAMKLYLEDLEKQCLSDRVMRLTLGAEYAFERLQYTLAQSGQIISSADDMEAFMKSDKFICTRHVFISKSSGRSEKECQQRAEEVLRRYQNGASMSSLIASKYNEDVSMSEAGYYFTYGEMDERYEAAAFALSPGQVSDIVETDDGFFLIERMEKSASYMASHIDSFSTQITYALVNEIVRARQKQLALTYNDYGRSLIFTEMK